MRALFQLFSLAMLATSAPATAQFAKLAGIPVATCTEPNCGGLIVRIVPWQVKQIRQTVGSPNAAEEPYGPLSAEEQAALTELAQAMLRPLSSKPEKSVFDALPAEYWPSEDNSSRPSSLDELRKAEGGKACTSKIFSLSDAEDKVERYGLIVLDCSDGAKKSGMLIGVALKSGQPVRMVFGVPRPVYAPLSNAKSESGK